MTSAIILGFALEALARPVSRQQAHGFCNRVLDIQKFSFSSLWDAELLEQVEGNVYQFIGSPRHYDHEIKTLIKFSRIVDRPIIVIGNLPGFSGVPSVDAIMFGSGDAELVNITAKTDRGFSRNSTTLAKTATIAAENSVRDNYSAERIAELFGFRLVEGRLVPFHGVDHQKQRAVLIDGLLRVLGLGKDGEVRPVTVLVDLSEGSIKWPNFGAAGPDYENIISPEDVLMHVRDANVPENEREHLTMINISHKIKITQNEPTIRDYYFLFAGSYVKIDSSGFTQVHHTVH